jgi:hypothetical protein
MVKYIMVEWPEIQNYMDHPGWGECILCQSIEGHECPDSAYMVPEDIYDEVHNSVYFSKTGKPELGDRVIISGEGLDYMIRTYDEELIQEMKADPTLQIYAFHRVNDKLD